MLGDIEGKCYKGPNLTMILVQLKVEGNYALL